MGQCAWTSVHVGMANQVSLMRSTATGYKRSQIQKTARPPNSRRRAKRQSRFPHPSSINTKNNEPMNLPDQCVSVTERLAYSPRYPSFLSV